MRQQALSYAAGLARLSRSLRSLPLPLPRLGRPEHRDSQPHNSNAPVKCGLSTEALRDRLSLTVISGHPDVDMLRPQVTDAIAEWQAQDWHALGLRMARLDRIRAALPSGDRMAPALGRALFRHIAGPAACAVMDKGQAVPHTDLPEDPFAPVQRILAKDSTDPALHFLAAHFQLELGWARRGDDYTDFAMEDALNSAQARFRAANTILDRITVRAPHSSYFAELDYRVRAAEGSTEEELTRAAVRWSRTDQAALTPFALHGLHMLPRWYGSEHSLRAFADKSWSKTHETLGAAAYAAAYLSAIEGDLEAILSADLDVFREGLIDMMQVGEDPDLTCNAILRVLWDVSADSYGGSGRETRALRHTRQELRQMFYTLVRQSLGPVMPEVWGGRWTEAKILHALAEAFAPDLAAGKSIAIGLQGAVISD